MKVLVVGSRGTMHTINHVKKKSKEYKLVILNQ